MNSSPLPTRVHTLLIISSDQANMRLMTQLIATRDDVSVLTACNGSDGLELMVSSQPEVVVVDTGLSDICATLLLKSLRATSATSHIPVIAVSSDAQLAQIDAGLQAGFYRYLTKPYRLGDLLDAIDSSLRYSFCKADSFDSCVNVQWAESKVAQV